jgi:hypothetical protein
MTPEEEAYEEALRRIRFAEETGALELDLSQLALNRLPAELESLTPLQELNLEGCELSDISLLAGLLRSNRSTSPFSTNSTTTCTHWQDSPRSRRSTSPFARISAAIYPRCQVLPRSNRSGPFIFSVRYTYGSVKCPPMQGENCTNCATG